MTARRSGARSKPVRGLQRGLQVLHALSLRGGATVAELAAETKLPRPTVYRLVETLAAAGYVSQTDGQCALAPAVRDLADGYVEAGWVRDVARPLLEALGKEVVWPVVLVTCAGTEMIVREATERRSPLVLWRHGVGHRMSMLTPAGLCYLAFCDEAQRDMLLDLVARGEPRHPMDPAIRDRAKVDRMIAEVRRKRYAVLPWHPLKEVYLAVPVLSEGRVFAALSLRYFETAMTLKEALGRYLDPLHAAAAAMGQGFAAYQPG